MTSRRSSIAEVRAEIAAPENESRGAPLPEPRAALLAALIYKERAWARRLALQVEAARAKAHHLEALHVA